MEAFDIPSLAVDVTLAAATGIAGLSIEDPTNCLYAPRIDTAEQVAAIVAAVSSKPVNVLIDALSVTVAEAAALGVRRIGVEETLARTEWAGFLQAAQEIAYSGSFSRFEMLPNVDAVFPSVSGRDPVCAGLRWGGRLGPPRCSRNRGCCPLADSNHGASPTRL